MPSSISSMAFSKSVIVNLFLSQEYNHIVDHGDHLIKAHFLSLQCQFDEIQVDIGLTTTPC